MNMAYLTDNGRLDGFSSEFTRRTGLEVVQPRVSSFAVTIPPAPASLSCTVGWNCANNPPGTTISLAIQPPAGSVPTVTGLPLAGSYTVVAAGTGDYELTLVASLDRNGETRDATQSVMVTFT